jgi:hypothetical protein
MKTAYHFDRAFSPALFICFAILLAWPHASHASLGGTLDSIESDRKRFEGRLALLKPIAPDHHYRVHEITQDGNQIREYSSSDGKVFAVSWRGPTQPDLSILLGTYFQEYQESLTQKERTSGRTAQRRGRSARILRSKNLVVERSGHMRDVRGKAYLPDRLPKGFHSSDIQE